MQDSNNSSGFSLVELILAVAIFAILAVSGVTTVLHTFTVSKLSEEEHYTQAFAKEGLEAVRSIKNKAFSNLTDGVHGLQTTGNTWGFAGSNNLQNSKFTREILISPAQRDVSGNIVDSGGTPDPDTKKVTSTVTWDFSEARTGNSTSLVTYLTNFRKSIAIGGPIMMAYSKTTSTPFYRTWDGSNWSSEGSASAVGGNINYVVLKSSHTRNEAILGTLDANGNIYIQIWNGTSWGNLTSIANVGSANATTRSFDIDYEQNGDRAIIAYLPNSTSADFSYRIWNGSTLTSASTITAPPTTGLIKWIEVSNNPLSTSNDISLILFDANADIYGMIWNGTTWGNMGTAAVWDATASTVIAKKGIDVTYEQTSGRVMFVWGDATATDQYYRIWNGTSLTAATLLDIPASGGIAEWVQLESRPGSNEIMYGVQDAASDFNTRKWSGSAWDTASQHPEHDAAGENITSRNFDIVWETHSSNPGKAWILWGDGATVSKKQWSGSAWGSSTVLTGSDDTSFVRLRADAISGAIFVGIYEASTSATDDIWESYLTGGGSTWSTKNTIWAGPISAEPVYFRIDIATP